MIPLAGGAVFAIGVRERQNVLGLDVEAAARQLDEPAWTRLALINTATGAVTLADGRFDNFATAPVWSGDGTWLIFDAPFDESLFLCDVRKTAPTLTPVLRGRGRPAPLIVIGHGGR